MLEFKAVMGANGRIVIPVKCRNALHLTEGEIVVIRVNGEEANICSSKTAIKRAQDAVMKVMKGKKGLVKELIDARRTESKDE